MISMPTLQTILSPDPGYRRLQMAQVSGLKQELEQEKVRVHALELQLSRASPTKSTASPGPVSQAAVSPLSTSALVRKNSPSSGSPGARPSPRLQPVHVSPHLRTPPPTENIYVTFSPTLPRSSNGFDMHSYALAHAGNAAVSEFVIRIAMATAGVRGGHA